jgi:hypothetical protein
VGSHEKPTVTESFEIHVSLLDDTLVLVRRLQFGVWETVQQSRFDQYSLVRPK